MKNNILTPTQTADAIAQGVTDASPLCAEIKEAIYQATYDAISNNSDIIYKAVYDATLQSIKEKKVNDG